MERLHRRRGDVDSAHLKTSLFSRYLHYSRSVWVCQPCTYLFEVLCIISIRSRKAASPLVNISIKS
jgi:hypothetical protein